MSRLDEIEAEVQEIEAIEGAWVGESIRYLLARVRALEAGLTEYGRHKEYCFWATPGAEGFEYGSIQDPCECGLAALAGEA